ncbi:MAG: Stp1/IreP family PP2C-type Ser/Thr phosphatase [Solirubrobacteraceae bacterium]|nr:Stp1/IreP family PP2C-type Ser/Thr phosphatase [Solirubrobacteraceae bacterium]
MLRVVEHAAFTDTGRQRRANEDALFSRSPLFAVADGMGGAKAGEIASRTAIDVIGLGVEDGIVRSRLVELVRRANRAVHEAQIADLELSGMGTTVTVAHVGEEALTVAHVGDSRAYLMRGGSLRRLTDDHSLVEEMRRSGKLTAEEAANHPQRSIITRALGPDSAVEVDVREFKLERGDIVLLCSDGLTGMIPESRVGEILAGNTTLDVAGRSLIAAANAAGGRDNITVVLLRVGDTSDEVIESDDQTTTVGPALSIEEHENQVTGETGVLSAAEVRAAAAAHPGRSQRIQARDPRAGGRRGSRRRRKGIAATLAVFITVAIIALSTWVATRVTYFIGTKDGYVSIYQGAPYELPLGLKLYRSVYRSGVPITSVEEARRKTLLDHQLRTGEDARDLIKAVERDELSQAP